MKELMEEYLPKIYSASFEYDMFEDTNYTETFDRTINASGSNQATSESESNSNSNSSSSNTSKYQNTPQNSIQNLQDGKYLSNASISDNESEIEDTTTNETTSSGSSTQENIEHFERTEKRKQTEFLQTLKIQ